MFFPTTIKDSEKLRKQLMSLYTVNSTFISKSVKNVSLISEMFRMNNRTTRIPYKLW